MSSVTETKAKAGLQDVVAGESAICYIDGERGVLSYCGYDIHDLADMDRGVSFEEVCFLLWHRRLPTRAELGDLQTQLAAARVLPEPILRAMKSLPAGDGMDALRTLTSMLGHYDSDAGLSTPQANYRKAVRLTGQLSSLVATWGRMAAGAGRLRLTPRWAMPPIFCTC
jgi:citrate synthase